MPWGLKRGLTSHMRPPPGLLLYIKRILKKRPGGRPHIAFRLDLLQGSFASTLFPTCFRVGPSKAMLRFALAQRRTVLASTLFPICFRLVFLWAFDVFFCSGKPLLLAGPPNVFVSTDETGIWGVLNNSDFPVAVRKIVFVKNRPMKLLNCTHFRFA